MEPLIEANKNVAEALFGWKPGRPTISRRIGGVISQLTGMSPEAGTHLWHAGLVIGVFVVLSKKK